MAIVLPDFPNVNGNLMSWVSVEPSIGNLNIQRGMKDISFKWALKPGVARGAGSPRIVGRTRGIWEPEASFTMYKEYYAFLVAQMGDGFAEIAFDLQVNHRETLNSNIITDTLIGCRIAGEDNSYSDSIDPLVCKIELSIVDLLINGVRPMLPDPGTQ